MLAVTHARWCGVVWMVLPVAGIVLHWHQRAVGSASSTSDARLTVTRQVGATASGDSGDGSAKVRHRSGRHRTDSDDGGHVEGWSGDALRALDVQEPLQQPSPRTPSSSNRWDTAADGGDLALGALTLSLDRDEECGGGGSGDVPLLASSPRRDQTRSVVAAPTWKHNSGANGAPKSTTRNSGSRSEKSGASGAAVTAGGDGYGRGSGSGSATADCASGDSVPATVVGPVAMTETGRRVAGHCLSQRWKAAVVYVAAFGTIYVIAFTNPSSFLTVLEILASFVLNMGTLPAAVHRDGRSAPPADSLCYWLLSC